MKGARKACLLSIATVAFALLAINVSKASSQDSVETVWKPSPTGASLRSLAFPGWGQAYNMKPLKAVIIGGIEEGLIFGVVREHQLFRDSRWLGDNTAAELYKEQRNRLAWLLAGSIIYSMVDAFVDAHLYGFDVSEDLKPASLPGGIQIKFGLQFR